MWDSRLAARARLYESAVLSVVDPSGYPASVRCAFALDQSRELIAFTALPPSAAAWRGAACLLFHRHDARLEGLHQLLIRGDLVEEQGSVALRPSAFVTANGRRDTDRMPHAGSPLHLLKFMLLGRRNARDYLAKRGAPWPTVGFSQMLRALDE